MTRTVRQLLASLGYRCHTPAELFGTRVEALGADDTSWLARVAGTGWIIVNRDAKIMERPHELEAYRAAKVHMFYLPGEATRDQLRGLVSRHLHDIVTRATSRNPEVWRITGRGVERFVSRRSRRRPR